MEKTKRKNGVSPYLIVILSLVGVILTGTLLLSLPFAHKDGNWGNFLDSLFISTSATCVTGLSTYAKGIGGELTTFGQVVVLVMIQIGGLGFVTILTFIIALFIKRLKFRDRLFLSQAINSTSIAQVGKFAIRVVIIVVIAETIGFLLGIPVFLQMPETSVPLALWRSLFISISAFNNAGFDIFGATSLIRGVGNTLIDSLSSGMYYYLLSYIMILIIIGGLSFVVIIDFTFLHKKPRQLNAFTKMVLLTTGVLLVVGFASFCLTDCINGTITPFDALFQSVTTRTAGFASFDQDLMSTSGKAISCLLMFIGGSPISTAGGIKTTTLFIIILAFVRFIQGKKIGAFKRDFSDSSILKAMSLVFVAVMIIVISFLIVNGLESGKPGATTENVLFEVFSAFGTVGLTANLTTSLTVGSRIVIIILMFFGRLGPITLFQVFENGIEKEEDKHYQNLKTDIIIG